MWQGLERMGRRGWRGQDATKEKVGGQVLDDREEVQVGWSTEGGDEEEDSSAESEDIRQRMRPISYECAVTNSLRIYKFKFQIQRVQDGQIT
jgi:hypothetical protein